ncbi:MAG: DUF2220 family protein [Erysipelotrichaceae bacterium]|nr:DUF2220 family protein [Erysipelotrichaceae bacterium]
MGKNEYIKEILSRLIRKLNKRELQHSDKENNRPISVKPKEIYKPYGTVKGSTLVENDFNDAAQFLEDKGYVFVKKKKFSDDIASILLNQNLRDQINKYLSDEFGITPRDLMILETKELIEQYTDRGPLTEYYCEQLINQLDHSLNDVDVEKEEKILSMLDFLQSNKADLYVREASMIVFGASKVFEERPFYDTICTMIRNATDNPKDEFVTNDEVLKDYYIHTVDQEILLKGDITVVISGTFLSVNSFTNGISLTSSDIPHIESIRLNTGKMITVENKTAFYRFSDPQYCVMYLGGYANRYQIDLLKKIFNFNPNASYYHFGDIDIGGFLIHQHLCRTTSITFDLFHMGIEDLHNPKYKKCLQSLTENDRERAKSLLLVDLYKSTVETMLAENIKLEQEIICLNLRLSQITG